MTTEKHIELIEEFIQLLAENRFYDAHESLEEIWFPRRFEESDEVKLIKGFINASVSFELIKKGRIESSEKVWKNYVKYRPLIESVDSIHLSRYQNIILHITRTKERLLTI